MSDTETATPVTAECPIAVVFADGMHSCTLPRGHKEKHDYNDEPDEDAE